MERIQKNGLETGFTRVNTRAGDLMTVMCTYNHDGAFNTPRFADRSILYDMLIQFFT